MPKQGIGSAKNLHRALARRALARRALPRRVLTRRALPRLLLAAFLLASCAQPTRAPSIATPPAGSAGQPEALPSASAALGGEASPTPAAPGAQTAEPAASASPDYPGVAVPTVNPRDPLRFTFPTPIIYPTPLNWRPPVAAVPISVRPQDHFWFTRPVGSDSVNWPLGSYRYGSTYFGQMNIHAGIDIDAPLGTPVLATGPGEVVWAGWGLFFFQEGREDDPYGMAVTIKHDFGYHNQTLYTLYAHLSAYNVYVGQRVKTGDLIGLNGVTGNTTGPHVHFEVRVGQNDYFHTRNPELWIAPYSGWGILAGQLLDASGHYIHETPIEILDARNRLVYTVYTYGYRVANPDDEWRENFAISDLPAGIYTLRASIGTADSPGGIEVIQGQTEVIAGQTNFVILQAGSGLVANATPALTATPPYPSDTPIPPPTQTPTATSTSTRTPRPTATLWPTRTRPPSATAPGATAAKSPTSEPPGSATPILPPTATP